MISIELYTTELYINSWATVTQHLEQSALPEDASMLSSTGAATLITEIIVDIQLQPNCCASDQKCLSVQQLKYVCSSLVQNRATVIKTFLQPDQRNATQVYVNESS